MEIAYTYRDVKSVEGLKCTSDGRFEYRGREKKVIYPYTVRGAKATARVQIMIKCVNHYYQAAKLVAETWKAGYEQGDYITYKDGDIHNICADNLTVEDHDGYYKYMRRNSGYTADNVEERKRKLQLVADEALMTKRYFETHKMDEINRHVSDYLYKCLMTYTIHTLHLGEKTALNVVPEAIARMYEVIMAGMCLFNYERYCKKLLLNYKKKGDFGLTGKVPKPIRIEVEHLNLECLWERYNVTKLKKKENSLCRV